MQKISEMLKSAVKRLSEEQKIQPRDVMIVIYPNPSDGYPKYKVSFERKDAKEMSFNDIMGMKVDFMGYGTMIQPTLMDAFERLHKGECEHDDVRFVIMGRTDGEELVYSLCKSVKVPSPEKEGEFKEQLKFVKYISLEIDIMQDENAIMAAEEAKQQAEQAANEQEAKVQEEKQMQPA